MEKNSPTARINTLHKAISKRMRNLFWYFFRGALAGAIRVAEKVETGVIVFIVCDGGWKYLSLEHGPAT